MAKLTIRDIEDHVLAFDLRDVLGVLAPESLKAVWTVCQPENWDFEATGPGGLRLEELADEEATIGGDELLALADNAEQVIWGTFVGTLPEITQESWVTIRAVDSSFYEVETSDEAAIARLLSRFTEVAVVDRLR